MKGRMPMPNVPGVQPDDGLVLSHRQGDLGERSPTSTNGDQDVAAADKQGIAHLPETCGQAEGQVGVAFLSIQPRQDAQALTARFPGAPARRLHHAWASAAQNNGARDSEAGADVGGGLQDRRGEIGAGSDYRDVWLGQDGSRMADDLEIEVKITAR
jgi:hypothetical protein